ncbi:BQ2448_2438 [Microbotryum intermedium]|uniref:BQ2448_2438 protein n=1 Tax=Microbotryum intermedium TaxID=269621 RepID=A0A238FE57_9BASI|nr:BQ2448_2438 [Microbotryum intermedium]
MPYDAKKGIYTSALPDAPLPANLDTLSIYEFLFGPVYEPVGPGAVKRTQREGAVWLIDSVTGRTLTYEQAHERTLDIAKGFAKRGLGQGDTVVIFSSNEAYAAIRALLQMLTKGSGFPTSSSSQVDYATGLWATFRLGGMVSCANPSYTASELAYQLSMVHKHHPVKIVLASPESLAETLEACKKSGLPESSVILIREAYASSSDEIKQLARKFPTLDDIAKESCEVKLAPLPRLKPKSLAFLSFSFGTTGLPKAVEIPHRSLIANVLQSTVHWRNSSFKRYDAKTKTGDVIAGVLPCEWWRFIRLVFHIYGLVRFDFAAPTVQGVENVVVLHISVYNNTPVCVIPKFQLETFLGSIQKYKITALYVVPPIVILLAKSDLTKVSSHPGQSAVVISTLSETNVLLGSFAQKYDLSSVRISMAGAAPLTAEIFDTFTRKFPNITAGQGYGATESCTIITKFDPAGTTPGASAGLVFPNIEIKIVSPEGKNLPPGGVGELWSRSPSNAMGYLANEKATKETWDEEGFLHTGDECYIDDKGHMYVVDRIKELIKVSGNQVAPAELEGFLLDHPLVNDCAVIGIPDDFTGEKPKAFVALPPAEQEKLAKNPKHADEYIASIKKVVADNKIKYKHLAEVAFLPAIPKTASGKLLRKDLRVLHAKEAKLKKEKL